MSFTIYKNCDNKDDGSESNTFIRAQIDNKNFEASGVLAEGLLYFTENGTTVLFVGCARVDGNSIFISIISEEA